MNMKRIPIVGGNWNNGANAGVFSLNLNNARSNVNNSIGARPDCDPASNPIMGIVDHRDRLSRYMANWLCCLLFGRA